MSKEVAQAIVQPQESFTNGADHTDKAGQAVRLNAGVSTLVTSDTALTAFGAIQNGGASGEDDSIVPFASGAKAMLKANATAGAIVAGSRVAVHTDGTFKLAASGKAVCGIALEAAGNDQLFWARLMAPVLEA